MVANGMHKSIINGPTLSPQGQLPPLPHPSNQASHGMPPPPGLRSPPGPPAYSNGYTHHVGHQNGKVPNAQPHTSYSSSSDINGANSRSAKPASAGWSASYSPPQPAILPQQASQYSASQKPHSNSFDRQRPGSSHSINNIPSPIKNTHTPSSPHNTHELGLPSFSPLLNSNGNAAQQPSPILQPPAYSPVKQQSSPNIQATLPRYSSPTIPPPLQQRAPSSPGLSPTKHSPPRPTPGSGIAGTPILPPVANLSPSPRHQEPYA